MHWRTFAAVMFFDHIAVALNPVCEPHWKVCDRGVVHNLIGLTACQSRSRTDDVLVYGLQIEQARAATVAEGTAHVRLAKIDVLCAFACGLDNQSAGALLTRRFFDLFTQPDYIAVEHHETIGLSDSADIERRVLLIPLPDDVDVRRRLLLPFRQEATLLVRLDGDDWDAALDERACEF